MKKIDGRELLVDREKCVKNMEGAGMYAMCLVASARARELKRQHKSNPSQEHPIITAMMEIQNGELGKDYLSKIK
jgi:hypothetical protein